MVSKAAQDEGPGIVPGPIAVVLHLDVVGVYKVTWHVFLEYGVVSAVGKRLHVGKHAGENGGGRGHDDSPVIARRGVTVCPPRPHGPTACSLCTVARPYGYGHFLTTGRALTFPLGLIATLRPSAVVSQVLTQCSFVTAAGRHLEDEVITLFCPEVLPSLLLRPISRPTHPTQAAKQLLLEGHEASGMHERRDGTLIVTTNHFH